MSKKSVQEYKSFINTSTNNFISEVTLNKDELFSDLSRSVCSLLAEKIVEDIYSEVKESLDMINIKEEVKNQLIQCITRKVDNMFNEYY